MTRLGTGLDFAYATGKSLVCFTFRLIVLGHVQVLSIFGRHAIVYSKGPFPADTGRRPRYDFGASGRRIDGRQKRIAEFHDVMTNWRRDIHAHPDSGSRSDALRFCRAKARRVRVRGASRRRPTGVVGRLRAGMSPRSIGLRADMDALPIEEATNLTYRSRHQGRMHACGHDGHTAMLLGAARYLAETREFDGTVNLIFNPPKRGSAAARRWSRTDCSSAFRADGSLACTIGRGSQLASSRSAPAR